MKIRCLLIDDEPIALEILQKHVQKLENLEITGICANAVEAFELLRKKPVDLIFLDIQMPKITGIDFLRTLKNPPKVIIVSAYRDYALEGFELDVMDYLLKPVSFERFLKAIDKYYNKSFTSTGKGIPSEEKENNETFIWVRADRKNLKIEINDIRYIEGLKDYVKIYLENQMVISKATLKDLEAKLPADRFLRIHRSYLVAVQRIKAFTHDNVEIGRNIFPIGISYRASVTHFMRNR